MAETKPTVNVDTYDSAAAAEELARALEGHAQTFRARVPSESGTPLLRTGQDGSIIDRHGRVLLTATVPKP